MRSYWENKAESEGSKIYMALIGIITHELNTIEETHGEQIWQKSMQVEYDALMINNNWVLGNFPKGKKAMAYK